MKWDVELDVSAPAERLFDVIAGWHSYEKLLKLASVVKYNVVQSDGRTEYFWLSLDELPFKRTYSYGKRLMLRPTIIVTIFNYRFLKSRRLASPAELEKLLLSDFENFFYQTVRLSPLVGDRTRLRVMEPGGIESGSPLSDITAFYEHLGKIAEQAKEPPPPPPKEEVHFEFEEPPIADFVEDYDPYTILQIKSDATLREVKRAYRSLAMRWHPDRVATQNKEIRELAHNKFIEITAAYHAIMRSN